MPEKMDFMLWLLSHDSLFTNELCFACHLASTISCVVCPPEPESVLHCLWECPRAMVVWMHLGFTSLARFFDLDLCSWVA